MLLAQHIADRLTHSKCDIERLKQSRVAEWLEQALHRTPFEHSRARSLISLRSDEDDWNLLPTKFQFLPKAGSDSAQLLKTTRIVTMSVLMVGSAWVLHCAVGGAGGGPLANEN